MGFSYIQALLIVLYQFLDLLKCAIEIFSDLKYLCINSTFCHPELISGSQ
ncbi:hypothetical protein CH70_530 [Francisella tularensis subsp. novicida]|nr:hypothetical protein AS84_1100 [Francisella tularensis subsp. novicida F6168]AJJ47561.1 hypothetical protein CH70_530 [Francisella tularensis subsp. novicida]APC98879.1 hypothetical protein KX03_1455 [Francisella tularensis subsp. novicida]